MRTVPVDDDVEEEDVPVAVEELDDTVESVDALESVERADTEL